LDGIRSLCFVDCTTQLGLIGNLAESALDPAVFITDENIKH